MNDSVVGFADQTIIDKVPFLIQNSLCPLTGKRRSTISDKSKASLGRLPCTVEKQIIKLRTFRKFKKLLLRNGVWETALCMLSAKISIKTLNSMQRRVYEANRLTNWRTRWIGWLELSEKTVYKMHLFAKLAVASALFSHQPSQAAASIAHTRTNLESTGFRLVDCSSGLCVNFFFAWNTHRWHVSTKGHRLASISCCAIGEFT